MRRPRILIGSSVERLGHATALQKLLDRDFEVTVWNQGVFKPTEYTMEGLQRIARSADFGIFIFADEDMLISRGRRHASPRDNILFECGYCFGVIGRSRSIIVSPRGKNIKMPSDLRGIAPVHYDDARTDGNLEASLSGAAFEIKNWIAGHSRSRNNHGLISINTFDSYAPLFAELIDRAANEIILLFIHSRRWRENNNPKLRSFLKKGGKLFVYLPSRSNKPLLEFLNQRFDDGSFVGAGLLDAYGYFCKLKTEFSNVQIYSFDFPPSYSLYVFDQHVLVSLYPNSIERQPTPTLHLERGTYLTDFFERDLASIRKSVGP